jgi:hypothetical protein
MHRGERSDRIDAGRARGDRDSGVATIVYSKTGTASQFFGTSVQFSESANVTPLTPEEATPDWVRHVGDPLPKANDLDAADPRLISAHRFACGWPQLCLWGEYGSSYTAERRNRYEPRKAGGSITLWLEPKVEPTSEFVRGLPTRPIWRGVLINAGIYFGAWLAILLAVGWARRRYRVWLRFCAHCGADVRGLEPAGSRLCPDCRPS